MCWLGGVQGMDDHRTPKKIVKEEIYLLLL
jgi:hypothetical protein